MYIYAGDLKVGALFAPAEDHSTVSIVDGFDWPEGEDNLVMVYSYNIEHGDDTSMLYNVDDIVWHIPEME